METKEIEIFRLSEIIARSMREELSDDERRVLDEWLAQDERHRTMYAAFGREEVLAEQVRLRQTIDWQGDCRMFMSRRKSWRRRKLLYRSLRYAALFILLLSGATVWWVNSSRTDDLEQGSRLTDTRHRAFLTLAGGEQIVLSQNDTLTVPVLSQKGANIEIRENQITYSTVSAVNDNIPCNTLTTPRGREYLLTLSDGTRVWLNTESQLRYPVQFTGERRTVYLVGEAYFDVHPDASHPFTVISGPAEVTVLGTSFNLRAYPEEDIVTTRADVRKGRRTKCAPDTRRTGVFGEDKRLHDQTGGRHLSAYRLERRADCFPQYAVGRPFYHPCPLVRLGGGLSESGGEGHPVYG